MAEQETFDKLKEELVAMLYREGVYAGFGSAADRTRRLELLAGRMAHGLIGKGLAR